MGLLKGWFAYLHCSKCPIKAFGSQSYVFGVTKEAVVGLSHKEVMLLSHQSLKSLL